MRAKPIAQRSESLSHQMITEDQLELQCLGWFREGGWETVCGPDIGHDGAALPPHPRTLDTVGTAS